MCTLIKELELINIQKRVNDISSLGNTSGRRSFVTALMRKHTDEKECSTLFVSVNLHIYKMETKAFTFTIRDQNIKSLWTTLEHSAKSTVISSAKKNI